MKLLQWRKLLHAIIIPTVIFNLFRQSHCLGSMADIAAVYGESGSAFCSLIDISPSPAACHGSNSAVTYATPHHYHFLGLTAGDGFACGLLADTRQPYCWGSSNYVQIGVPQPMEETSRYSEISAGDNHLCGLRITNSTTAAAMSKGRGGGRRRRRPRRDDSVVVDCWGYNMTKSYTFNNSTMLHSISAGSGFNCAIFSSNHSAVCWGDDTNSNVVSLTPMDLPFRSISSGGYHVCGILAFPNSTVFCWGRTLEKLQPPGSSMASVVCGRFHTCGSMADTNQVTCWGFHLSTGKPLPPRVHATDLAAGDYFTCAVVRGRSPASPLCWGLGFPSPFPLAVIPGDTNEPSSSSSSSRSPSSSEGCPMEFFCRRRGGWLPQISVISGELLLLFLFMAVVSISALVYIRRRVKSCSCAKKEELKEGNRGKLDELKTRRAKVFTYKELERATDGFSEERQVGKGSFSRVFKGVLLDGTVVAVKRAAFSSDQKKNSKEFKTELDLLSRLNHAHLLTLLGYCEEGGERLLVYEFMANGSLHHHLHGGNKTKLDWVRRVTIAVQAARGIEYLHGYACPPVIHRDIKSSNILIDEEHNARVSDFGLSLLGPAESGTALAELPAGTLGYLDPEYYRLHYLTTKSDVYSFGVMLLELVSGRRAIDMRYERGNVVEWAVPKVRGGEVREVLDPELEVEEGGEVERALREVAKVACRCVRMRGRDRPSMEAVTTALEQALLLLLRGGGFILPTEVVLGSSRLHQKRVAGRVVVEDGDDERRTEFRAPSWITFPSVGSSSQRRKEGEEEIEEEVV